MNYKQGFSTLSLLLLGKKAAAQGREIGFTADGCSHESVMLVPSFWKDAAPDATLRAQLNSNPARKTKPFEIYSVRMNGTLSDPMLLF